MRKSFIATLVLGALVIASCQKENDYAPKAESPIFTASFDTEAPADPDTKTHLVVDNKVKKSLWDSGDAIRLLNGTNTKDCDAVYSTENEGETASFKTEKVGYKGSEFIAMYPANPAGSAWWNAEYDKTVNKLWLTDTQTAVEGGYDPKAHIAVAYTNTKELAFKNVVALLKISVSGAGVEKISVSADKIVGNFSYNTETGKVSKDGENYSNPSTVTLSGTFTDGKDYYIAVLPGTYSTLTLKVNDKVFKTKATESEFKANSIYNMGTVNVVEEEKEIVMTIDKQNNWKNVYIYAWDYAGAKIFGEWPGTLVEGNTVTFPKEYYKAEVNYILNDGTSLLKTVDLKATLSDNFSVVLPADNTPGRFIVYNCPDWGKYLYIYNNKDNTISLGSWGGASLSTHDVYAYKYCDISAFIDKDFNFILNGDGHKTKDLWTYGNDGWVKKDGCHYYTYNSSHQVE